MIDASRRPTVLHPALQKRRVLTLERVTLRPAHPTTKLAARERAWVASPSAGLLPLAAAALIAAVPLAHAGAPGPPGPIASLPSAGAPPALQIALAPEPIPGELAPRLGGPEGSVADIVEVAKLEGLKANPYEAMATARPRVRKPLRVAVAEQPAKVSDLKANPYD